MIPKFEVLISKDTKVITFSKFQNGYMITPTTTTEKYRGSEFYTLPT